MKIRKTMRSRGFYVLCYSREDYEGKKGETKKIGPFGSIESALDVRQMEIIENNWYHVEVGEKVIDTDY